ncbi:hypothetical protein K2W90_04355 [Candidatus Babeliales bacterium]|nr:hypothetical protein [Candidatus Babeliales bacterium]
MKKLFMISLLFATSQLNAAAEVAETVKIDNIANTPDRVLQVAGKEMIAETLAFVRAQAAEKGIELGGSVYELYLKLEAMGLRQYITENPNIVNEADSILHEVIEKTDVWFNMASILNEENSTQDTRLKAWSREFFEFSKELIAQAKERGNFPADFVVSASPKERILLNNGKKLNESQEFILAASTLVILGGFAYRYDFMLEDDFNYFVSEEFKPQFRKILANLMVQQS